MNSTEINGFNTLNRRQGLHHGFDRNDDFPRADIADPEYQMLADELPVAPVVPVAQPLPLQPAYDYAAEAWKGEIVLLLMQGPFLLLPRQVSRILGGIGPKIGGQGRRPEQPSSRR